MQVEELMVKDPFTITSNDSVYDAVKLMNKHKIGCLLIVDYGKTVGILTERDIMKRIVEKEKHPKETMISEVMTKQVVVGEPTMEVTEAAKLMFENKVKKLPIVEDNQLVGLVTLTDIARTTWVDENTISLVDKLSNMHFVK